MAAYWLNQELVFPPPEQATEEGLIAIGGDASPERLLLAYSQGIFPWPQPELPLLWFSPDPRFVLPLDHVRLSRTLRKDLAKHPYEIRTDSAFEAVIKHCASAPRKNQDGTWITDELIEGYLALFRKGFAHSIEAWRDGKLVGGLYGVSLGKSFSGDSMFALEPNASKAAFVALLGQLIKWQFSFVDCQVHTSHLARFGAIDLKRRVFLRQLQIAASHPTHLGPWQLDIDVAQAIELIDGLKHNPQR